LRAQAVSAVDAAEVQYHPTRDAGGCLASAYIAAWVIARLEGLDATLGSGGG
jgi:hypothetical protein